MQINQQGLAATYRACSDDELAALAAEMETLTETAQEALSAEIRRRGMSGAQLTKLHKKELHRELRFDQKEGIRRKQILLRRLTSDPKGWIWALLLVLAFLLLQRLWPLIHH